MNALVSIKEGEVRASSQDVAAAFDKAHKDVLRAIDRLIELAPEIDRRNFAPISAKDRYGRPQRAYDMDRDGFSLLAMGFTGPKALQWKLKFIDAFNRMEEALRAGLSANDNGLQRLHPLLQSAEGRDALWKGREQVRLMKELKGREAALALWIELGLPLPRNFDAYLEHGNSKAKPPQGEMYAWIAAAGVKVNETVAVPAERLWEDYFNWCFLKGLTPYEPDKFRKHLRIHFGAATEIRRGVFALETGKGE